MVSREEGGGGERRVVDKEELNITYSQCSDKRSYCGRVLAYHNRRDGVMCG